MATLFIKINSSNPEIIKHYYQYNGLSVSVLPLKLNPFIFPPIHDTIIVPLEIELSMYDHNQPIQYQLIVSHDTIYNGQLILGEKYIWNIIDHHIHLTNKHSLLTNCPIPSFYIYIDLYPNFIVKIKH